MKVGYDDGILISRARKANANAGGRGVMNGRRRDEEVQGIRTS